MNNTMAILVDLDKCIGCYNCVVGCHQWHQLKDERRIELVTLGPERVGGYLKMYFFPRMTDYCDFEGCDPCQKEGIPACVSFCPTRALTVHGIQEALSVLGSGNRYQFCKLSAKTSSAQI